MDERRPRFAWPLGTSEIYRDAGGDVVVVAGMLRFGWWASSGAELRDGERGLFPFRLLRAGVAEVTLYWTPSVPGSRKASPWILWLGGSVRAS